MGFEASAVPEPDGLERLLDLVRGQRFPGEPRGHGHVLGGRQRRDEVVLLEDETDVAGAEPGTGGGLQVRGDGPEDRHLAAGRLVEARHAVQHRRLA